MNFILKSSLQKVFSVLPSGEKINYFFQKRISHSLPQSDGAFKIKVNNALDHYQNYLTFNHLEKNEYNYYEFGAGYDLIIPITFALLNFNVKCIDIRKLVIENLIRDTLKRFKEKKIDFGFFYNIETFDIQKRNILEKLKELNIDYHAPCDAANTGFPDDSFDLITSTDTLEHIPEGSLLPILNECYRILMPGGIMSILIDYQDHWAYADKNISVYNFLKYSDKQWSIINPSIMYQNRMRHRDYINLISKTDFITEKIISLAPDPKHSEMAKHITLNKKYADYTMEEILISGSWIVLRK